MVCGKTLFQETSDETHRLTAILNSGKGVFHMMAKEISRDEAQTREQIKNQKQEKKAKREPSASKRIRIRLIPIWLRVLLVIVFTAVSLAAGVMVGYGVIGDGNPKDALKKSTWTHIVDIVTEKK